MAFRIFVGYDSREPLSYMVTVASLIEHASQPLDIRPLLLPHLRALGVYRRPQVRTADGRLVDVLSGHPAATEFATTRFLVPELSPLGGWALFVDGDFLFRADVCELFGLADPRYAVMTCRPTHRPLASRKMDDQVQAAYDRKNWSSLMLFNTSHAAHQGGGLRELLDAEPGIELHQFAWLKDDQLGELPRQWNHLVGAPDQGDPGDALAAHFTDGTPELRHLAGPLALEWWAVAHSLGLSAI